MDGFFFLWIAWMAMIVIYFFEDNLKKRNLWLIICLTAITGSSVNLPLLAFSVNGAIVIVTFAACVYVSALHKLSIIYFYFISILLSGLYFFIYYLVYFEPVWLYVPPLYIISVSSFLVVCLLVKKLSNRLAVIVAGLIQGEIIFTLFLWQSSHPFSPDYVVGGKALLDILFLSILFVFCWSKTEEFMEAVKRKWYKGQGQARLPGSRMQI
ncbi:hypothetical protein MM300_17170 [Evansella sp. LMS18]|uniref:YphA family membrane protein n=1 Tax=Evansella sp. LMS18 TaxID=2924033 RepID=UPI0020D1D651|nr:hypothetical protein [Evansella sp. LMS18]UTR09608.1 hypothetical protein MM300_17170 [Evansella sp. LMS18]